LVQKINYNKIKSAFTVDVEDGVSLAMTSFFGVKTSQSNRVIKYTTKILELLEQYNTKATFFILGKVAEVFPELVKQIDSEGHEIGVHGYNHLRFDDISPSIAFKELNDAKKLIEDIIGKEVLGHRAPAFSINKNTEWALDIIAEAGFKYDSSIMPAKSIRYGWPNFPKNIGIIKTTSGNKIIEVPLSTIKIFKREIPVCGGGYLRLFPFAFTKYAFKRIFKKRPVILYLHPYELDTTRYPDYYFYELKKTPILRSLKIRSYWLNRKTVYKKIKKLLELYQFTKISNIIYPLINK